MTTQKTVHNFGFELCVCVGVCAGIIYVKLTQIHIQPASPVPCRTCALISSLCNLTGACASDRRRHQPFPVTLRVNLLDGCVCRHPCISVLWSMDVYAFVCVTVGECPCVCVCVCVRKEVV